MVEAGADEMPEEQLLEALELAHGEIGKLCEAQEELRAPGRQAEVARRGADGRAREQHGGRDLGADPADGLREARRDRRGARGGARARRSRWSRPRRTSSGSMQVRVEPRRCSSSEQRLDGRRRAGPRAVRGRPARAHRGRAGLEGAQVGEAPAALRPDHRRRRAAVPGRPGDGRRRRAGRSRTR